jgi:protein arginine kinase
LSLDDLGKRMADWLQGTGPDAPVILSSRIRLARNLVGFPFPHRADDEQRERVFEAVGDACAKTSALSGAPLWDLRTLRSVDRQFFVERHLSSQNLADGSGPRGIVVGPGERLGVMINEEDHLRIQSVASGLNLGEALAGAVEFDLQLEGHLAYAVSPERGYLTTCPTNVGTGLRASILIHLPALVLAGEVKKVHRAVGEMGMAVRGWFGEGSGALGDYYQLSNQRTLGHTEEEAAAELGRVAARVLELEVEAREKLRESQARRRKIEDRVYRAYGTLRTARFLTVEQVMACASDIRLGKWFGFLPQIPDVMLNRLALFSQPAHIARLCGQEIDAEETAWARAEWVRSEFEAAFHGFDDEGRE